MYLSWREFWSSDRRDADWLFEPILARGRGHAIYAKHKTGKSLLLLWIAARLAQRSDIVVIYLDYEMSEDDVHERLADMGYGPDSDLSRLRYALLPRLAPLDLPGLGPVALFAMVDHERAAHPDADVVVIIDTLGRAVSGAENDADTFRGFWTHTGIGLKQRGVTFARADHAGKDEKRGQRGSSGKGDDVDVIWMLAASSQGGLTLSRDAARMSWVPEKVALVRRTDPLSFEVGLAPAPPGTDDLVAKLDTLGLPLDASVRQARRALKDADQTASQAALNAAVKCRKERGEHP